MSEGKDMFPRSTIQEANRHLQALYHRVDELESIINEQQLKQLAADEAFKEKINEINRSHDTEVKVLDMRLRDLEKDVSINLFYCYNHNHCYLDYYSH
ncbi:Hypothetical predicted protein [Octopus vulgaris]|nr:Hypothetical predicted protein [Octopus vulgaris]